jgi:hypothetical protein
MRVPITLLSILLLLAVTSFACDDGPHNDGDGGSDSDTDTDSDFEWCDETTSLCWQLGVKQADWNEAIAHCDALSLGGHDDWYLPSVDELRSLIRGCPATETDGECPIVDGSGNDEVVDECEGCIIAEGPQSTKGCYWDDGMGEFCFFPEGDNWSSSQDVEYSPSNRAWRIGFDEADIDSSLKTNLYNARCVRAMD